MLHLSGLNIVINQLEPASLRTKFKTGISNHPSLFGLTMCTMFAIRTNLEDGAHTDPLSDM